MAYASILRQCSPGMRTKLEGQANYSKVRKNGYLLGLLILIQAPCCKFEANMRSYWAMTEAHTRLNLFWQE